MGYSSAKVSHNAAAGQSDSVIIGRCIVIIPSQDNLYAFDFYYLFRTSFCFLWQKKTSVLFLWRRKNSINLRTLLFRYCAISWPPAPVATRIQRYDWLTFCTKVKNKRCGLAISQFLAWMLKKTTDVTVKQYYRVTFYSWFYMYEKWMEKKKRILNCLIY